MSVARSQVDDVRNALNPLEIIRETVPSLKQSGHRWRGLCPFHNERTPSFFFMPDKGLWHCFGSCQEGGDVFKFIMKLENLTFPEALRQLAAKAGIKLQWEKTGEQGSKESQERERLMDLLSEAAAFYRSALLKSADAEIARKYLVKRGVQAATAETFQLGYAALRDGFLDGAIRKGLPIELLVKAGLAARSAKSGRYYDPQFSRLVFPIMDAYGRVVGFGGRTLEENPQGPKYLNSPETPVYTKSRHLYGLFQGRSALRTAGRAVLVEGYMDVVGCHQAGMSLAVAPLGTAFTKEQAQLLKRYVQETVLLYDPDDAGVRASGRSAEILIQNDLFVRVARLPDGLDPDEYALAKGAQALEDMTRQAPDVMDFWLDRSAEKAGEGLPGKLKQAQELLQLVSGVPNALLREEWIKKISRRLSLDEAALGRELEKKAAPKPAWQSAPKPSAPAAPRPEPPKVRSAEEEVVQILCLHADARVGKNFRRELFGDRRCLLILEKLSANPGRESASLAAELAPEDANWFTALLMEEKKFAEPQEALAQRLKSLESLSAERERQTLEKEVLLMLQGAHSRDEAKIDRYKDLTRQLKGAAKN